MPSAPFFVCYWVVPVVLPAGAALASHGLTHRMIAAANSPDVVRRTTFVAFRELVIDELYHLAQQKAEREVGAGMEAYAVQVGKSIGAQGVGSTSRANGDEARQRRKGGVDRRDPALRPNCG